MRVLVVDNYDSFVYNLVQMLGELGAQPLVFRNDAELREVLACDPDVVLISPGPGSPERAGISNQVISHFSGKVPVLGVCLGHQCVVHVFGGKIVRAKRLVHGKTSNIRHDGKRIFEGVPNPFQATRYHSLVADVSTLPPCLRVTALSEEDGEIMAVEHRGTPVFGVQFHPESILTQAGRKIMENFLREAK